MTCHDDIYTRLVLKCSDAVVVRAQQACPQRPPQG